MSTLKTSFHVNIIVFRKVFGGCKFLTCNSLEVLKKLQIFYKIEKKINEINEMEPSCTMFVAVF